MDRYEFYSNLQTYQKNSLEHYGILGQKWGKRRWQNSDGTFNAEGKERYFGKKNDDEKIGGLMSSMLKRASKMADKIAEKQVNKWNNNDDYRNKMINKNADIMKKHRSLYGMDGLNDDEIDKLTKAIIKKGVADIYEVRKEAAKYKADKKNYFNDIDIDDMQIHDWVKSSEVVEDHPMFKGEIGGLFSKKKVDDIFNDDKKSEKFTKDLGLKTKGKYSWEDNLKTVRHLNKDLYDSIEGRKKISDNTENIIKLVKALDKNNKEEYEKILDNIDENDKTVVDLFSKDIRKLKDWYEETEGNIKEIRKSQNNLNPYFEYKLRHEYEEYDTHDVGYPGSYEIEDYNKGTSKSAKATKLINENPEKHFNNILDKLYDELTDKNGNVDVWDENKKNISKNDFKKMMINQQSKLVNSGDVNDKGTLNLFLNDGNLFWGHVLDIDYNPITGDFEYYGTEG